MTSSDVRTDQARTQAFETHILKPEACWPGRGLGTITVSVHKWFWRGVKPSGVPFGVAPPPRMKSLSFLFGRRHGLVDL